MKPRRNVPCSIFCIVLLLTITILLCAGCTDSAPEPAAVTATAVPGDFTTTTAPHIPGKTTAAPPAVSSVQPVPSPVSSTGIIRLDPISDKKTGGSFTLTGTSGLAEGSDILWQIYPDPGRAPRGLEKDSTMSVGGNYRVLKGENGMNRIAIDVSLGRLVPGRYVAIVGKMNGREGGMPVFEINEDYGYTYFTLG